MSDDHRLTLTATDKLALYAAFMPFIKGGALFVATSDHYQLGAVVSMRLSLMQEPVQPVAGKVVWITPSAAEHNRAAGIGVQLNNSDGVLLNKIEKYLAVMPDVDRPTDTL
jgi:type IV pilus assembly protein PilZ